MVDFSGGGDFPMTQPVSQVGGVNAEQGRWGHQVFIILTDHTHHLPTLVTPPNLHIPEMKNSRENTERTSELVVMETKQPHGFLGDDEFRQVVYIIYLNTLSLTGVVEWLSLACREAGEFIQ